MWRTTRLQLIQHAEATATSAKWDYQPPEPENEQALGLHPLQLPAAHADQGLKAGCCPARIAATVNTLQQFIKHRS